MGQWYDNAIVLYELGISDNKRCYDEEIKALCKLQ